MPVRLCKSCIGHGRRPTEPGSGRRVSPGRWIPGTLDILHSPSPADRGPDPRADYPDGVPDLSGFDLDEIATALADQDSYEHAWLVNPDTGEIVLWTVDTGIDGQTAADLDDLDEQGLIGITRTWPTSPAGLPTSGPGTGWAGDRRQRRLPPVQGRTERGVSGPASGVARIP